MKRHWTLKYLLLLAVLGILGTGCSAPPPTLAPVQPTPLAITPTATSIPPTAVPVPPTAIAIPSPTATSLPDFVLPGARTKYSFEQIIPLLSTPQLVGLFMRNNVKYDVEYDIRERQRIEYEPAALVYERGIDDANGYAVLECYFLERNGWDAFVLGLSIETPTGSNICGINTDRKILVLEGPGQIAGPYGSFADLAKHYAEINWMRTGGTVKSLRASQVNQLATDITSPSILNLPWVNHPY